MAGENRTAIVISASSDIGTAMSLRWISRGWDVTGTYRTKSPAVEEMEEIASGTGWTVARTYEGPHALYTAVLERDDT